MGISFSVIHHSFRDSNDVGIKKIKIKTVSDKGILKCYDPFNLQVLLEVVPSRVYDQVSL